MRSDERAGSSCKRLELTRLNRRGFTFYPTRVQEWDQFFWKPQNERNGQPGNLYHLTKGPLWPKKILLSIHPRNFGTHALTWPYACTSVQTLREGEGSQEPARRGRGEEYVIAELWRAQSVRSERSTIGKKIWLSMRPRNFGYETIVHTSVRTPPFHVSRLKFCISSTRAFWR